MQQRSEETRSHILASARALFAQNGYEASGVAEICQAAGVSKGAFYHHFHGKQAVFLALLKEWLAGLDTAFSYTAFASGSVPAALDHMAGMTGAIFNDASGQLPIFLEFWTQSSRDPLVWQQTIAPYHRFVDLFAQIIARGVAEGSLRPLDTQVAARVLVGTAVGVLLQGMLDPEATDWTAVMRDAVNTLVQGWAANNNPNNIEASKEGELS